MEIDITETNNVTDQLIGQALESLPNGYDTSETELRLLSNDGNKDAQYIVREALRENHAAMEYAGRRW